jgi:hypothetical protein
MQYMVYFLLFKRWVLWEQSIKFKYKQGRVTLQMLLALADYLLFFHLRIKYGRNLMAFWCMDSLGILWSFSRDKMKLNNKQEPTIMCDNSQTIHCLVCWSFSFSCRKIIHENVISMIQEIGYINNLLYSHC